MTTYQMHRERRSYVDANPFEQPEGREVSVDAQVLRRDDGFALAHLGKRKSFAGDYFHYAKNGAGFEFAATRELGGGTRTDTYYIFMAFNPGQKLGATVWPLARRKVEAIATNIESALRAWPIAPGQELIPIGVIGFRVFTWPTQGRVLEEQKPANQREYFFVRGRPTALRRQAPSPRWKMRTVVHRPGNPYREESTRKCDALVRDDGVHLIRIPTYRGPVDDGPDSYHYADHEVSFDFTAERRLCWELVTDTWEVRLDNSYMKGLTSGLRARLGRMRCAEIVNTIEEALYAWPHDRGYDYETPINRVVFLDAHA